MSDNYLNPISLNDLSKKLDKINKYRPLTKGQIDEINRQKKIEHVWSSNALEGNTLTLGETEYILETGLTVGGKPLKDYEEAVNLNKSFEKIEVFIREGTDLTEDFIKELNKSVMVKGNDDIESAGIYRPHGSHPSSFTFNYLESNKIDLAMKHFVKEANERKQNAHPVEHASWLHFHFVTIHPFSDGNGRVGRLLMEFGLVQSGYPITNILPSRISKMTYNNILHRLQKKKQRI